MRARGEGEIWTLVFLAVLGLLGYGGYAVWRDNFAKPDDRCYWMIEQESAFSNPCLIDIPTPDDTGKYCMSQEQISGHVVICDERRSLPEFAQKAGRRICGQKASTCKPKK